ncbi:carbon monoxide dehydrogenase accessory protein CooC [soil metagenome]
MAGKGGVGKTTVSGALCIALANSGMHVTAVDADGSPNLSLAFQAGAPEELPAVANAVPPADGDSCGADRLSGRDLLDGYAVGAAAGVQLLQTGRIERPSERCLCCGSHATAREVLAALPGEDDHIVVADLEAGVNDLLWAKPGPDDMVVVVTDASRKSLEVARRIVRVSRELGVQRIMFVANKVRSDESDLIDAAFPGVEVLEIGYDPALDGASPDARRQSDVAKLVEIVTRAKG